VVVDLLDLICAADRDPRLHRLSKRVRRGRFRPSRRTASTDRSAPHFSRMVMCISMK
jgi:hypothetical protein